MLALLIFCTRYFVLGSLLCGAVLSIVGCLATSLISADMPVEPLHLAPVVTTKMSPYSVECFLRGKITNRLRITALDYTVMKITKSQPVTFISCFHYKSVIVRLRTQLQYQTNWGATIWSIAVKRDTKTQTFVSHVLTTITSIQRWCVLPSTHSSPAKANDMTIHNCKDQRNAIPFACK